MILKEKYDLIVVGGGHIGNDCYAAATLGSKGICWSLKLETIVECLVIPAIGGIAQRSRIIRELMLGGGSGIVTDESSIQFRMLNRSKGLGYVEAKRRSVTEKYLNSGGGEKAGV